MDKLAPGGDPKVTGVSGNPTRSSVAYGKMGLELTINAAVAQIRELVARNN
jgi:creatinine amidohydrolase/Fe(II)-dependent formamide hydrolase-like protein